MTTKALKSNRLVSVSKEEGYKHLQEIEWTGDRLQNGVMVKLKKVPFLVRLFKIVAPNGDIDWVITNSEASLSADDVQDEDAVRWQVEQLHRELKQLTGIEKCQCRKQRPQRNHIACCYQAWLAIKSKADEVGKTLYALAQELAESVLGTLYGADVTIAEDGQEALVLLDVGLKPSFVLMDLSMPVMDGFTAYAEIRKRPKLASLPVIALTAHAMKHHRQRVEAAAFTGDISKPFLTKELITQIQAILG